MRTATVCFLLCLVAGCQQRPSPTANDADTLDANRLHTEYMVNEVAADQKYKGGEVRLRGRVKEVARDIISERPYVLLDAKGVGGVRCFVPREAESSLASLHSGQQVTVGGVCQGKSGCYVNLDMVRIK